MPKGSSERTAARKEEIISACEKLYQTMHQKNMYGQREIRKQGSRWYEMDIF